MERQQYSHQPYAHQPYAQYNAPYPLVPPRARTVNDILPASIPGVLGGLQVVLWLAIIGLEAGGLWYDAWRACKTIDWLDVTGDILGIIGLGCRAKLPILKGLLACAILMFLSSITYIIAYIAISIWLCKKGTSNTVHTEAVYQSSVDSVTIRQQQPDSLTRGYEHTGPPENHRP
ncbi:unnamed protein product [Adineta steineri]|uniref:MARVEL domain-containing protein n=1 Tax=Adineta steineri TaxID=433720 RepID=A0A813MSV8_9BILA|nr:unnamed protein product [Adineta steineri]CAF0841956.1 unnamed protein product [Adineta steineri]CAF0911418.1 unnamed protein product [Adineta steineri]